MLAAGAARAREVAAPHRGRGLRAGRLPRPGRDRPPMTRVNDDTFVPRRQRPAADRRPRRRRRGARAVGPAAGRLAGQGGRPAGQPGARRTSRCCRRPRSPVADRPAIRAHLAEVARCHPPFAMHLAGTGTFSPVSEVVFVAVARGIGNCELHRQRRPARPAGALAVLPVPPARHRGPRRAARHARLRLQRAGRPVGGVPGGPLHRVRADARRGLGGRPRVPAHRSAALKPPRAGPGPARDSRGDRFPADVAPARAYAAAQEAVAGQRRRRPWLDHLARAGGRYQRTQGDLMAAGVTYFAFLGLFPVLLLAASVVRALPRRRRTACSRSSSTRSCETFPGALGEQLVHEVVLRRRQRRRHRPDRAGRLPLRGTAHHGQAPHRHGADLEGRASRSPTSCATTCRTWSRCWCSAASGCSAWGSPGSSRGRPPT